MGIKWIFKVGLALSESSKTLAIVIISIVIISIAIISYYCGIIIVTGTWFLTIPSREEKRTLLNMHFKHWQIMFRTREGEMDRMHTAKWELRERKWALWDQLHQHLERPRRLPWKKVQSWPLSESRATSDRSAPPAAHPEKNHSPIAAGRSATPTVLWKARNREGLSFLPFSHFLLPEGKWRGECKPETSNHITSGAACIWGEGHQCRLHRLCIQTSSDGQVNLFLLFIVKLDWVATVYVPQLTLFKC